MATHDYKPGDRVGEPLVPAAMVSDVVASMEESLPTAEKILGKKLDPGSVVLGLMISELVRAGIDPATFLAVAKTDILLLLDAVSSVRSADDA